MPTLTILRSFWRDVARRDDVERDLDDELHAYVEALVAEHVARGLDEPSARALVARETGTLATVKEQVRAQRVDRWLYTALPDVRLALRLLRRAPLFTLLAVLTLAVGVGGATGIAAVADATFVQPPRGVADARQLVALTRVQAGNTYDNFGYPDFADVRDRARSVALAGHRTASVAFTGPSATERIVADVVTAEYFAVLGVVPARGRLLALGDDAVAAPRVAVVSEAFWRRSLDGDPRVVGRTVTLNGQPFTIVGVAGRGFAGTGASEPVVVWLPMAALRVAVPTLSAGILTDRSAGWLALFGRLPHGVRVRDAERDLRATFASLAVEHPATNEHRSVVARHGIGLTADDRAEAGRGLVLLGGAVALLFVVTCVNVAGLVLARSTERRTEVASRLAMGATRERLARQILTEGLVLALLASPLAIGVAWVVARLATVAQPATATLHAVHVAPNGRLLLGALALATLAGVLLALAPAARVSAADPAGVLRAGTRGAGGGRSRLSRGLVALQVAVTVVLLAAAGLTVTTVRRLLATPPGFDPHGVAVASLDLGMHGHTRATAPAFWSELLDRLRALPGVESATLAKTIPPRDWSDGGSVFLPGQEPPRELLRAREMELGLRVRIDPVAPRYFATLRVALRRGRDFDARDVAGAPGVAIVSERLAALLWPGRDAVGQRIAWPSTGEGSPREPLEVVGVAADTRYLTLTDAPPPLLYVPLAQEPDTRATIAVRVAEGRPIGDAVAAVVRTVRAMDPALPVSAAESLEQRMEASLWRQRMLSFWMTTFGVVAVALSTLGLYGVAAQAVARQARETSVRIALGAPPRRIARQVAVDAARLTTVGLLVGLPGALGAIGVVRATVEGTAAGGTAPIVAAAALLVGLVTLAAVSLPARRASRADPAQALRAD